MSGVGKFKLTDALPKNVAGDEGGEKPSSKSQAKAKSKKTTKGKTAAPHEQAAEQVREARESARAKNAGALVRDHMVEIGRGNQQAGRQKAK